jgi:hypothetical protein
MGAAPAKKPARVQAAVRVLRYTRDMAGFNNVRLMFESLACVAHLTQRRLILPPPSRISHLGPLFHELQVYDAAALRFDFGSGDAPPRPNFRGSLQEALLADAADLCVDIDRTRLQHFECLRLSPAHAQEAARVVLSMRPHHVYLEAAVGAAASAGLDVYDALHLRRGDFAAFRPGTQWSGAELARRVRAKLPGDGPLLVACVVQEAEADPFPDLAKALLPRRVLRSSDLFGAHAGPLHRLVVDTLLLARAAAFAGTPDSTFSTGVWHWRARERVAAGRSPETPQGLGELVQPERGACWRRCTTFEALRASA